MDSSNSIFPQNAVTETTSEAASWIVDLGTRAIGPTISIVIIVVLAFLALRLLKAAVNRAVARIMERHDQPRRELTLKANTLSNVIESAGRMLILLIATMMVLSNIGVDIAPLLASAGVVGLAIGFGAQSLIKDFIAGFFILLEDQYSVGDVITISTYTGLVEHLSLRRTALRAVDGTVITVPNGNITDVQNLTKDWARAVLDIDISYDDDIDRAIEVIGEVLTGIETDEILGDVVIAPADILGVQALGAYQVTIRAMVKTKPMEQWGVQRELNKRIKLALDRNDITIPYPHQVMIYRSENGSEAPEEPEILRRERETTDQEPAQVGSRQTKPGEEPDITAKIDEDEADR